MTVSPAACPHCQMALPRAVAESTVSQVVNCAGCQSMLLWGNGRVLRAIRPTDRRGGTAPSGAVEEMPPLQRSAAPVGDDTMGARVPLRPVLPRLSGPGRPPAPPAVAGPESPSGARPSPPLVAAVPAPDAELDSGWSVDEVAPGRSGSTPELLSGSALEESDTLEDETPTIPHATGAGRSPSRPPPSPPQLPQPPRLPAAAASPTGLGSPAARAPALLPLSARPRLSTPPLPRPPASPEAKAGAARIGSSPPTVAAATPSAPSRERPPADEVPPAIGVPVELVVEEGSRPIVVAAAQEAAASVDVGPSSAPEVEEGAVTPVPALPPPPLPPFPVPAPLTSSLGRFDSGSGFVMAANEAVTSPSVLPAAVAPSVLIADGIVPAGSEAITAPSVSAAPPGAAELDTVPRTIGSRGVAGAAGLAALLLVGGGLLMARSGRDPVRPPAEAPPGTLASPAGGRSSSTAIPARSGAEGVAVAEAKAETAAPPAGGPSGSPVAPSSPTGSVPVEAGAAPAAPAAAPTRAAPLTAAQRKAAKRAAAKRAKELAKARRAERARQAAEAKRQKRIARRQAALAKKQVAKAKSGSKSTHKKRSRARKHAGLMPIGARPWVLLAGPIPSGSGLSMGGGGQRSSRHAGAQGRRKHAKSHHRGGKRPAARKRHLSAKALRAERRKAAALARQPAVPGRDASPGPTEAVEAEAPVAATAEAQSAEAMATARARNSLQQGHVKLFEGDPAAAERHYRQALKEFPSFTPGYRGLGLALARQGRSAEAIEAWTSYVTLVPRARDVWLVRRRIEQLRRAPATAAQPTPPVAPAPPAPAVIAPAPVAPTAPSPSPTSRPTTAAPPASPAPPVTTPAAPPASAGKPQPIDL